MILAIVIMCWLLPAYKVMIILFTILRTKKSFKTIAVALNTKFKWEGQIILDQYFLIWSGFIFKNLVSFKIWFWEWKSGFTKFDSDK